MAAPVIDHSVLKRWSEAHPKEPLLVWVSGGKDAFVCLKLAVDTVGAARIFPVYRYLVEGVRCIEVPVRAQLKLLGITNPLTMVPSLDTLSLLQSGTYTTGQALAPTRSRRQVKFVDLEALARKKTGCLWTVSGEKQIDNVMRRLWLRPFNGIDEKGHRLYPVHLWSQHQVRAFCRAHNAPLAPNFGGEICSGLGFDVLDEVKVRYPDDYRRIIHAFPFAEAVIVRDKLYGKRPRSLAQKRALEERKRQRANQVSDRDGGAHPPDRDQAG